MKSDPIRRIPEQPCDLRKFRRHGKRPTQKITPKLNDDLMILTPQPVIKIQMRQIAPNKHQVAPGVGGDMRPDMPDTRIRLHKHQLILRMIMPEKSIPQPRGKESKRLPHVKPDPLQLDAPVSHCPDLDP